jgi:hypothetical protein
MKANGLTQLMKLGDKVEWVLLCVILLVIALGFLFPKDIPFDPSNLLLRDSSVVAGPARQGRLDMLMSAAQHQHSVQVQVSDANDANRMQARLFFVAVLAGLASVAFASPNANTRRIITYALLSFGGLLYALDVHMRDIGQRQAPVRDEFHNTIAALTRVQAEDSSRYDIDYTKVDRMFSEAHDNRWSRKVCLIFFPNMEQSVFYLLPMVLFLVLRRVLEH